MPKSPKQNPVEAAIAETAHFWLWSGFYTLDDVLDSMPDWLPNDVDVDTINTDYLDAHAVEQAQKKRNEELSWKPLTDCDRLDLAFHALQEEGIFALENAGLTADDALQAVNELANELATNNNFKSVRYLYYLTDDIQQALTGNGLSITYGQMPTISAAEKLIHPPQIIAKKIIDALEAQSFAVEWSGTPTDPITIPDFKWQRRTAGFTAKRFELDYTQPIHNPLWSHVEMGLNALHDTFCVYEHGSSYMQIIGHHDALSIECRLTNPQGFFHYRLGKLTESDTINTKPTTINFSQGHIEVQANEVLTLADAMHVMKIFFETGELSDGYLTRDIADELYADDEA